MRKNTNQIWIIPIALALGYLLLRGYIALIVYTKGDLRIYKNWAFRAARDGVTSIYDVSDSAFRMDYPPLYAYILWVIGKFHSIISSDSPTAETPLPSLLVQIPPFIFDIVIGSIFYLYGRAMDNINATIKPVDSGWSWRIVLPMLYLMNPAILFFAYWALVDSVHMAFITAAFIILAAGAADQPAPRVFGRWSGPVLAWICLSLATLMKPLALPFWPLLVMLTLTWLGMASLVRGMLGAGAAALLVLGPFAFAMGPLPLFQRLSADLGSMPLMSVNAHNLWWVLGGWQNAEEPWLGPITATQVGIGLFGLFLAVLLSKGYALHRRQLGGLTAAQGLLLAWLAGVGFFMLSTHLHENHLLIAIPLLLPVLPLAGPRQCRTLVVVFLAISIGVLLNGVLQDRAILAQAPFSWGGTSDVWDDYRDQPYPMVQLWALRGAVAWNIVLFCLIVGISFWPRKGLLDSALGQAAERYAGNLGAPRRCVSPMEEGSTQRLV